MTDCQKLREAIERLENAVDLYLARIIIRDRILPIVIALIPGFPLLQGFDPDTASAQQIDDFISGLLSCQEWECSEELALIEWGGLEV